jgi:hypothetical protein
MTPKFLRDEAARFRGMAESSERESSRLRLLAMATDYEARAGVAADNEAPAGVVAEPDEPEAPEVSAPPPVKSVRKSVRALKETSSNRQDPQA